MARSYEYVIHGPPLSSSALNIVPKKTLSTKRDHHRRDSDLRNLYRSAASPTDAIDQLEPVKDSHISSPTTPKLPPTPPTADDLEQAPAQPDPAQIDEPGAKSRSVPVTPVLQNSPPTPENTPPRDHFKPRVRPYLTLRPSIASTRAESFRTARETSQSEDESEPFSPRSGKPFLSPRSPPSLPQLNGVLEENPVHPPGLDSEPVQIQPQPDELLPSSPLLPGDEDNRLSYRTVLQDQDTPDTQFEFGSVPNGIIQTSSDMASPQEVQSTSRERNRAPETPHQPERQVNGAAERDWTLRDRVRRISHLKDSASTEAFANVIGWNDGGIHGAVEPEANKNRWSAQSNPSAVEAYVIDSPIKPRKRGTLRKVVKNDSLRSTSSPLPASNRTSLQSSSDSPHRLVHKKQKLTNEHRWSIGSEISKRSLSWGSSPAWSKQEVITVAVIPEQGSPFRTSTGSVRRQTYPVSGGLYHPQSDMPGLGLTTPPARAKRGLADVTDETAVVNIKLQPPTEGAVASTPTSRSASRVNSVSEQQFSQQREQAERDLRSTLDRMESERLSASLRRDSHPSLSPSPAQKDGESALELLHPHTTVATPIARQDSSTGASTASRQKSVTLDVPEITPGTKEWADLRPSTVTGTPFSQTSVLSFSPEIIEARAISFFPHHNDSLQLIEPNRLSETPAVKAVRGQYGMDSQLAADPNVEFATPRVSTQFTASSHGATHSPLRNPRKPPDPPQVQFAVIPPTPSSEQKANFGPTPDTSPAKDRNGLVVRNRPSLQGRDRSESFIKTLTRNLSLRNAKNPKQNQDLDSTLHPFWRPRAFWDDEDYRRRMQQEEEKQFGSAALDAEVVDGVRNVTVLERPSNFVRSNTISSAPLSLVRRISERRRQKRAVEEHIASQQALVKQTSFSSLQKLRAGRRLYGLPPIRSLSMNMGIGRLNSLRQRLITAKARREDEKREMRRERLRKSIGPEVVMTGDSRFPDGMVIEHFGGQKLDPSRAMGEMLEHARAEDLVEKRGLRL